MKTILKIVILLGIVPLHLFAQKNEAITINGSFKALSFPEFVAQMEANYPIHFYYKDEWVDSIEVNLTTDSTTIPNLMDKVLKGTKLDYAFIPPGTIYLLPTKKFVHSLPSYYMANEEQDTGQVQKEELTNIEEKYLLGRQPDMIETIVVGSRENRKFGKAAVITGKLTDGDTGEPLIGATMYIPKLKRGAATDAFGTLSMALKPGYYSAVFRCIGMSEVKGNLDVRSDGFFSLKMKEKVQSIEEVVVQGEETQKRGTRLGMESVSIKTMKELPTLMGEKDVLKVAQMLPGIVSVGEGSAGVNVRGGNADQNLFYINEIPIYNSSHLFGFFSAINSSIIENFSIYKGQVPAKYGGRLSSVFNIETRKGHKNKFFTKGGVSPISANAEVEIPLVKEKVSLLLSGRSSYSDWILKRLKDPDLRNSNASFYDFAGSLDFDLNEKNRIGIFGYNSNDYFNLNQYTEYRYGNTGASVHYQHRFSPRLKSTVALIGANYNFKTIDKQSATESYSHAYDLGHYEFRASLNWLPSERHTISGGVDVVYYDLNRGTVKPYGEESLKVPVPLGMENGLEKSIYIDDNISFGPRLKFYAGFRYTIFTALGPKTVREYYPNTPFEDNNVINTVNYGDGEKIVSYSHPEIRAGIDFKIQQNSSLKLSVTQMSQYLFMLSNTISIAPNDQWKLVDSHIKPPHSIQYSAGYYQDFAKGNLTASAEFYYKQAENVSEYRDGADFLSSPYVETAILQGEQEAYGAEFMLSKERGRLNGWASYAYSRSFMLVNGPQDWQDINQGKRYPSNFDKPNVFNLVLNYKITRRFSISSNVAYNTGRPITTPKGIYYIEEQPFVDYSSRNEYRIPDYLRFDASIKIEGNLKKKKPLHSYWMISVYNLTGRKNANSIFFISEDGYLHGYKYSVIGVPILTISWNWKLGNYAND